MHVKITEYAQVLSFRDFTISKLINKCSKQKHNIHKGEDDGRIICGFI